MLLTDTCSAYGRGLVEGIGPPCAKIDRRETAAKMAIDHRRETRGRRAFVLQTGAIPRCGEAKAQPAGSRYAEFVVQTLVGPPSIVVFDKLPAEVIHVTSAKHHEAISMAGKPEQERPHAPSS